MKALVLISGGLDSILAARVVKEEGIEIVPINFRIPFCHRQPKAFDRLSEYLGTDIKSVDIEDDFMRLIEDPSHGFGSNMNPCIDCKILMLYKAGKLLEKEGAKFVVTGEVLGQRPMSQHRKSLETIEEKSGLKGLLLRPLSARLLDQTIPEKEGWIRREKLLNFSGRQRRPQIELAEKFKIRNYAQPSGGCLLTDPIFSLRLKELISHQELNRDNVELLKFGRHFRLSDKYKLVVGRNLKENEELERLAKEGDYLFMPDELTAGPTSLGRGDFNPELLKLSCEITARYCDTKDKNIQISYKKTGGQCSMLEVTPLDEMKLNIYRT
jgi:tRNA-uridine 2-sulfurtransferase